MKLQRVNQQTKINKTESSLFEKINKTDKPPARLRKKKGHKFLISEIKEGTSAQMSLQ